MNDTLFYILNSRYLQKRATLITTNFQDVTAKQAADADRLVRREYLVDRIGQRLRSRLAEMCLPIVLSVPDYREARREGNFKAVFGTSSFREEAPPPPPPPRPRFGG
jgi:DNA replication protein DnaC